MSQDVLLQKNEDGVFDLVPEGTDFKSTNGLETAILLSLFTNARASQGEVPESSRRQGWSGNILTQNENYELGGELWTLDQARLDQVTENRVKNFARNSLAWLINDRIAETINVELERRNNRAVFVVIELFRAKNLIARYITLWRSTSNIG